MEQQFKKKKEFAIISLSCGLLFWVPFLSIFTGILAIVSGIIALVKIKSDNRLYDGKKMAIAGIALGVLSFFFLIIVTIIVPNLMR